MKLDLKKPFDLKKAETRFKLLCDKEAKIELTEVRSKRTVSTNAYQHALFSLYGMEFGERKEDVKREVFKIAANRDLFVRESINEETGEVTGYLLSTADLDQKQASLAIDRFRDLSSQRGLYLPTGEEYREAKFYIDQQIEQYKQYL